MLNSENPTFVTKRLGLCWTPWCSWLVLKHGACVIFAPDWCDTWSNIFFFLIFFVSRNIFHFCTTRPTTWFFVYTEYVCIALYKKPLFMYLQILLFAYLAVSFYFARAQQGGIHPHVGRCGTCLCICSDLGKRRSFLPNGSGLLIGPWRARDTW